MVEVAGLGMQPLIADDAPHPQPPAEPLQLGATAVIEQLHREAVVVQLETGPQAGRRRGWLRRPAG